MISGQNIKSETAKSFETIADKTRQDVFIFGDHASNHIPGEFDNLGLSGEDLTRHIAWDIGTERIIRRLCEKIGCAGQLAAVSRLVIDLNRDVSSDSLIPEMTDATTVPGNSGLSELERQKRIEDYHESYHRHLGKMIETLGKPFVISVHSFTPKPRHGDLRATEIGLLVKEDTESAENLRQSLADSNNDFNVGINLPYSAYDLNYTIDRHVTPRGLPHLAIEIRQDHIDTDKKAEAMADILADCLLPVIQKALAHLSS